MQIWLIVLQFKSQNQPQLKTLILAANRLKKCLSALEGSRMYKRNEVIRGAVRGNERTSESCKRFFGHDL